MATTEPDGDRLLDAFQERAGALGIEVWHVADTVGAANRVHGIVTDIGADVVVTTSELMRRAPVFIDACAREGLTLAAPGSPDHIRDAPLGMTLGFAAYAETGSVLLAEPTLNDRAVGMLVRTLMVAVATPSLAAGLDQAAVDLRALAVRPGGGYATIVTGPSRTADIEQVLTVGVQGPGRVVVVLVDALA